MKADDERRWKRTPFKIPKGKTLDELNEALWKSAAEIDALMPGTEQHKAAQILNAIAPSPKKWKGSLPELKQKIEMELAQRLKGRDIAHGERHAYYRKRAAEEGVNFLSLLNARTLKAARRNPK